MAASVFMVVVFLLLVYGVERNHLRQARRGLGRPGRHDMVGSTDVEDRDWARIVADLKTIQPR
jgi:hypothetical protein